MENTTQKIINLLLEKSPNPKLIKSAFYFAQEAYKDKYRPPHENYIHHAVRVAEMLNKINVDPTTIAFGILHDVVDDAPDITKKTEIREIEKIFGREMGYLIEKISNLNKIKISLSADTKKSKKFTKEKIINLRRMFLAIAEDLRVVLVELLSRLDTLNSLHLLPPEKQRLFAFESLRVFVPIAERLGLFEIRRKMEDVAFFYLFPNKFNWIKENVKEKYEERERYLKKLLPNFKKILRKEGITGVTINYRAKSYWSTYKKLIKKGGDFNKIHDLLALRIITANTEDCYRILGIIHKHFQPISEEINDYIAKPKANGYRSLHTTIIFGKDKIIEVQIRTEEMHKEAEYGICAHWAYKEGVDPKKENQEILQNVPEFWKTFKINFYPDKAFCLTPKGDIIVLPKNSTPVDFAYAVHSEIGNHCESAIVNGKISQLSYILENGDIVEIIVNKNKLPSSDWLKFVKTSLAKNHIKKLTDKGGSFWGFKLPGFIRKKIIEISEVSKRKRVEKILKKEGIKQIYLAGQKGILVHIAKCCNPQPEDEVSAYIASGRAAVLHKSSCEILKKISEKFPERIVGASWK